MLALTLALGTTQCKKDKDKDREKFLGTYEVVETCNPSGVYGPYTISITEGSGDDEISIFNLYDYADVIKARVNGSSFTISSQTFGDVTYSGNGSISGNTITIDFLIEEVGFVDDDCQAVGDKN